MTQRSYLSKYQIKDVTPHINEFCVKEFKKAVKNIQEGDEFQGHMEDFLCTKEYDELLESINKNGNTVEQIINLVGSVVDVMYDENDDFNNLIHRLLKSTIIVGKYSLWISTKEVFTPENYLDLVADVVDKAISTKLEKAQKQYAISKLNMITEIYSFNMPNKIAAIIATSQCGSTEELEQTVVNSMDFEAYALRKN